MNCILLCSLKRFGHMKWLSELKNREKRQWLFNSSLCVPECKRLTSALDIFDRRLQNSIKTSRKVRKKVQGANFSHVGHTHDAWGQCALVLQSKNGSRVARGQNRPIHPRPYRSTIHRHKLTRIETNRTVVNRDELTSQTS